MTDLCEQRRDLGGRGPLERLQRAGLAQQIVDRRPQGLVDPLPRDSRVELGAEDRKRA